MQTEVFNLSSDYCFYILEGEISEITNKAWQFTESNPLITLRFVRGSKMKTLDSLFNEFSAALQFPFYFGENWAAFDECLADLDWLPGDAFVILITAAEQMLRDEPVSQMKILIECFEEAKKEFQNQNKDLFVIFQYERNKINLESKLGLDITNFLEI